MQNKYKVGLMRCHLLIGALLLALLATRAPAPSAMLILATAAIWLGITAARLPFSHHRPARLPWPLLPAALLAALLGVAPTHYATWLWLWPALLLLPQPTWARAACLALAAAAAWAVLSQLDHERALLASLTLSLLLLLATAWRHSPASSVQHRVRLVPGLPLWSAQQLRDDLPRERARCAREGIAGELLLLQVSRRQLWPLAYRLCQRLHTFEHCYRLDASTLAVLLLSRDADQAQQRRDALLAGLPAARQVTHLALSEWDDDAVPLTQLRTARPTRPLARPSTEELTHD